MPSKFNVLSPEVDINSFDKINKNKKGKSNKEQSGSAKKQNANKQKGKNDKKNQNKKEQDQGAKKKKEADDLQDIAFCNEKVVKKGTTKNKKSNGTSEKQDSSSYEEWKKLDENFIEEANKNALEEAILQSTIEYEKSKTSNKKRKEKTPPKEAEPEKNEVKNKKKKGITLSLDEFHSNISKKEELPHNVKNVPKKKEKKVVIENTNIFEDTRKATQATIDAEKKLEDLKIKFKKDQEVKDTIDSAKSVYNEELERRDFEIQALTLENEDLKKKYKELNDLLEQTNMKSKTELTLELERVAKARDEYSQEVAILGVELEQERSKANGLSVEVRKLQSQGKKKSETT